MRQNSYMGLLGQQLLDKPKKPNALKGWLLFCHSSNSLPSFNKWLKARYFCLAFKFQGFAPSGRLSAPQIHLSARTSPEKVSGVLTFYFFHLIWSYFTTV